MSKIRSKCEGYHAKVYSGEGFGETNPYWFWICERCGEQGADQVAEPERDRYKFIAIWRMYHDSDV